MSRITTTKKIAFKVDINEAATLKQLFISVFGAKEIFDEHGTAAVLQPDGTLIELYSPHACFPWYLFTDSNIVVSYKVADIIKATDEVMKMGFKNLSGIIAVGSVMSYCHLKQPDGVILGLYQENF